MLPSQRVRVVASTPRSSRSCTAKRAKARRYTEGANAKVKGQAEANRKALAEAGIKVGGRGPLSKEAKAFLAQNKG